jgi:hypothetical protein
MSCFDKCNEVLNLVIYISLNMQKWREITFPPPPPKLTLPSAYNNPVGKGQISV